VTANDSFVIGLLLVQFRRADENILQSVVNTRDIIFDPGFTSLQVDIGPLLLVTGTYSVSVSAFAKSRKHTLFHNIDVGRISVISDLGHGPAVMGPNRLSVERKPLE